MLTYADGKSIASRLVDKEDYKSFLELVQESSQLPLLQPYFEGMEYVLLYKQKLLEDAIDASCDTRFSMLKKSCDMLELQCITILIEEIKTQKES